MDFVFKFLDFFSLIMQVVCVVLAPILLMIPSVFFILLIDTYTKKFSEKKKEYIKLFAIAFSIPFLNFLYFLIFSNKSIIPTGVSIVWMLVILPISFIILLMIKTQHKKNYILVCILMFIFFSIFTYLGIISSAKIIQKMETFNLEKYDNVLQIINSHKLTHGSYPENIKNIELPKTDYKYIEYEIKNSGKDFILRVSKYESFFEYFIYCSSTIAQECKPHKSGPIEYISRGKWIGTINND